MTKREEWRTAAEWAAAQLPGLPETESGFIRRAKGDGWPWQKREASGGGREYPLSALPEAARVEFSRRQIAIVDVPRSIAHAAATEPEADLLTGGAAEARDARLAIMAALDRFMVDGGLSRGGADADFCAAYQAGTIKVAPWVRAAVRELAPRTLRRWRAALNSGETHRLAVDKGAARRGRGVLEVANDGAVKSLMLAAMAKQPFLSADHLRALVADRYRAGLDLGTDVVELPSIRTFQTALKTWRETYKAELLALTNPDAFKNRMRVSGRSSHLISRVNELWMIDASPADVLTKDGRYTIYVAVEVFTRRIIISVSRTARASAVGLLLRRAIQEWGVPERVKTDNGSDFKARFTERAMLSLGIEIDVSAPYSPWQKGVVERAIRTVQHDLMATLPGFVGHSVADRKAIEGRKAFAERLGQDEDKAFSVDLKASELQDYCNRWASDRYAHRVHNALKGATPFEVTAASTTPIRTVDLRALDMLLAPIAGKDGLRTVGKEGVRIDGTMYVAIGVMPATEVFVRMDPADMGRAYLFDRSGENYLGEAIAPELAGVDPAEAVMRAQAAQKAHMAEGTAALRKVKFKPRDFADAILNQASLTSGNLVAFPKREEAHETPALTAAAVAAAPAAEPTPASDAVIAMQKQLLDDENVTPIRREETSHQRWNRALALKGRFAAGEPVDPADAMWLLSYCQGPEFKGFALTYCDPYAEKSSAEAGL